MTYDPVAKQCFFITPIGEVGSTNRRHADEMLNHYLKPVGEELRLRIIRGDEAPEPGSILRQIVEQLSVCVVAVADLTGFNPNVMYELAIAHSFRKPTVLVQRTAAGERLPFDVVQERVVQFDPAVTEDRARAVAEIKLQLQACLTGTTGTPVSTALDLIHLEHRDGKEVARLLEAILAEVRTSRRADILSKLTQPQGGGVDPVRLVDLGRNLERMTEQVQQLEEWCKQAPQNAPLQIAAELRQTVQHIDEVVRALTPSKLKRLTHAVIPEIVAPLTHGDDKRELIDDALGALMQFLAPK